MQLFVQTTSLDNFDICIENIFPTNITVYVHLFFQQLTPKCIFLTINLFRFEIQVSLLGCLHRAVIKTPALPTLLFLRLVLRNMSQYCAITRSCLFVLYIHTTNSNVRVSRTKTRYTLQNGSTSKLL